MVAGVAQGTGVACSRLRKWLSQGSALAVETRTRTTKAEAIGLRALAMALTSSAVAQVGLGSSTGFGTPGLGYEGLSDS